MHLPPRPSARRSEPVVRNGRLHDGYSHPTDEHCRLLPGVVGKDAAREYAVEERGIPRDRELESHRGNAFGRSRLADGRARSGQRSELLDSDGRPPGRAVIRAEDEWHLALDSFEHRVEMVGGNERRDAVEGLTDMTSLLSIIDGGEHARPERQAPERSVDREPRPGAQRPRLAGADAELVIARKIAKTSLAHDQVLSAIRARA
jgi:hypothetical protein